MSYLVRDNDTPQRVSAKVYGEWTLFPLIQDNNHALLNGLPENTLPMGAILYIPEPPALTDEFKHTIKDGDTYMALSEIYYESVSFFRKLEKDNNFIRLNKSIGTVITIPALVSKKVYQTARRILGA